MELANIGRESVKIAFRLGAHVDGFSRSLEYRGVESNQESWAYVVTGLSAADIQKEIDQFNADSVSVAKLPFHRTRLMRQSEKSGTHENIH